MGGGGKDERGGGMEGRRWIVVVGRVKEKERAFSKLKVKFKKWFDQ